MSTLAEIEAAIVTLPSLEQRELHRRLSARLSGTPALGPSEGTRRSTRGFPIVAGRRPLTAADVARDEAEA